MKGATLALAIGVPVVLGGGAAAFFLLRRRPGAGPVADSAAQMGALQAAAGSKAVSQMAAPGAQGQVAASTAAKLYGQGTLADPRIMGAAGKIVDKFYPGMGSAAAGVVSKLDKTIGTGLFKKIPGVGSIGSKLKLW